MAWVVGDLKSLSLADQNRCFGNVSSFVLVQWSMTAYKDVTCAWYGRVGFVVAVLTVRTLREIGVAVVWQKCDVDSCFVL